MIDVKEAVKRAGAYYSELSGKPITQLELEEVEKSDNEQYWLITLSYTGGSFATAFQKSYKLFKVDAETGDVLSMKIRQVHAS